MLLDDPLSAVDPRVGRILFQECLGPQGIMQVPCPDTLLLAVLAPLFLVGLLAALMPLLLAAPMSLLLAA